MKFKMALIVCLCGVLVSCKSRKVTDMPKSEDYSIIFQRLLDEGGLIELPVGRFPVSKSLSLRKEGTIFKGQGMDKTEIVFAPGEGLEIFANGAVVSSVHFSGTYLDDSAEQHSVHVRGPYSNVLIEKVKVSNGDDTGIRIGYALRQGKRAPANNCIIRNCVIDGIHGGSGIEVMSSSFVTVENNIIRNTYQNGIRIAGGKDCIVRNNTIERYNLKGVRYAYGVYVKGGNKKDDHDYCQRITVQGNSISGVGKAMSIGTQTEDVTVFGNKINLSDAQAGIGITLENNLNGAEYGYRNIVIRDNHIFGVLRSGIELHTRDNDPVVSGNNVRIENNKVENYSSHGISVRGNNFGEVKNIFIVNNYLSENSKSSTHEAIIISKCKDVYLEGNKTANGNGKDKVLLRKGSELMRRKH